MNKVINEIAMHRKDYTKPTMTIVPLKHRSHVLTSSPVPTLTGSKGASEAEDIWYELQ